MEHANAKKSIPGLEPGRVHQLTPLAQPHPRSVSRRRENQTKNAHSQLHLGPRPYRALLQHSDFFAGLFDVGDEAAIETVSGRRLLLLLDRVRGRGLPGRDAGDGNPEWAAGHVVEALGVEEANRVGLAAVLTANANLISHIYQRRVSSG